MNTHINNQLYGIFVMRLSTRALISNKQILCLIIETTYIFPIITRCGGYRAVVPYDLAMQISYHAVKLWQIATKYIRIFKELEKRL